MLFKDGRQTPNHEDSSLLRWFFDFDHLKTPSERWILFKIFFILAPGRGRDRPQGSARKRRFQQICGVALARAATRADERVRFVDEQNDRLG